VNRPRSWIDASVLEIAKAVHSKRVTACEVVEQSLGRIRENNARLGCFTRVFEDQARSDAAQIDHMLASGRDPGPLAGVPFAAKDLFDMMGLPTTAGSKTRIHATRAECDAEVVSRLKQAGAILVGSTNMDEFAYGFATINSYFGPTRNPHDVERVAGGSSGGSAAAVASGMVPIALGSDTNGSIRVPAGLCGIWGIRPADSMIPMSGVYPLVKILDTVGPFARSCSELLILYEILSKTKLNIDRSVPRVAQLTGWFVQHASQEVLAAMEPIMSHLGSTMKVEIPEVEAARSASVVMTASQAGALHLDSLRRWPMDYDPAVRDRLLAGTMVPVGLYQQALDFRSHFRKTMTRIFDEVDILICPCTPEVAPRIDDATIVVNGKRVPARANLGLFTQPLSIAGLPMVSAPWRGAGELPIGVQFVTAPGREGMLFGLLEGLERDGILKQRID
jgi:AtzE family amidohydrolase